MNEHEGQESQNGDGAQVSTGTTADAAGTPDVAIPELVIISGMSGAGRSTAAKCLEDLGWFVVDNLPPALIPTMVELGARSQGNVARIAVVVDVRGRRFFDNLRESLADLEAKHVTRRIVFLESSDDALVRRFESVRRPHPPGRRPHRRRHRRRARAPARAARRRRPGHRHLQPQRARAARQDGRPVRR